MTHTVSFEQGAWPGWWVLRAGTWAIPEGTSEEWQAIAAALRAKQRVCFKRVGVTEATRFGDVIIYSPRNSRGAADETILSRMAGLRLADEIDQALTVAAWRAWDDGPGA